MLVYVLLVASCSAVALSRPVSVPMARRFFGALHLSTGHAYPAESAVPPVHVRAEAKKGLFA